MSFSVFGYGSLVNRATLPETIDVRPARVKGWRRAWRASSREVTGGVCAVSVMEDAGSEIEGLLCTFDDTYWPTIEAREYRYDAIPLSGADYADGLSLDGPMLIFKASAGSDHFGDEDNPITLSYIDCILQGFLREFGADGVSRFMETTEGWSVPIVDDRAKPRYPRAQQLSADERKLVDRMLSNVDARLLPADDGGPPRNSW
ncbi:gamma-glutamylcyclotransferase [Acuticoccus sp. M5D2P5]|uniref:gamma-glutamylcyclotransferase family protein n=1 Tax=Acuticoccus kalidii TaxID=2910977 RepID=UPI001F1D222A|nr:gamma-glutamylcyclotransferase family protein [Acuticoccus kalidii]MCF3932844.1 gamma-glutamylcyclotransferase [Acuticoccus kalidii]